MRVSSSDIKAVRFPVTLRGYAEDEVDALLALVIETLLEYEQKDAAARAEIDRLRSALDGCREALVTENQGALRDLYRETESRMREMLDEAVNRAERIVGDALAAGQEILRDSPARVSGEVPDPGGDSSAPTEPDPEVLVER